MSEAFRLYAFYTDENAALKDRFVASLRDDWILDIRHRGPIGEGGGDFGTPGFERIVRDKMVFLAQRVREHAGRVILWSDVDIQFFRPCGGLLSRALDGRDLVILAEHWPKREVNTGFMAIRCNERTLRFFDAIVAVDFERLPYHEQSAMNDRLARNPDGLRWEILPKIFWCKSSGGPPPLGIALHHANCTRPVVRDGRRVSSLELKIEQLDQVKRAVDRYTRYGWLAGCAAAGQAAREAALGALRRIGRPRKRG